MTPTLAKETAVLPRQPVVLVDDPHVAVGVVERAVEQRPHLGLGDVAVADPATLGLDLDERLEPQHPPRAVAPHRHTGGRDGVGDGIGAECRPQAASHGTQTVVIGATLGELVEPLRRQGGVQGAVDGAGRADGAQPQAEDLTDLDGAGAGPPVGGRGVQLLAAPAWQASPRHRATRCATGGVRRRSW
jgi:hypothetical protein